MQAALGEAIQQLEHYILEPVARGQQTDLEVLVKVSYALAQAASVFKTLTEASALEEVESLKDRVYALESDASRLRA